MAGDLKSRIDKTFNHDRIWATGFVIVLWAVMLFVMFAVRPYIADSGIEIVCWIALGAVGLFNTASITAMLRHYNNDKQRIYSIDIRHLDEMAARR
jgi:hypothetical protein